MNNSKINETLELLNLHRQEIIVQAIKAFNIDILQPNHTELGTNYHNLQIVTDWNQNSWEYDKTNNRYILLDGNKHEGREDDDNFLIITTELSAKEFFDIKQHNSDRSKPIKVGEHYLILDRY